MYLLMLLLCVNLFNIVCCLMFNLSFYFEKVSWNHITLGHKFLIISICSPRLAFVPLMFYCMIFFFLVL